MPNFFAYMMMTLWPIISIYINKKFDAPRTAILVFLAPYLLLPEKTSIDLPILPAISKEILIGLTGYLILRKSIAKHPFFTQDPLVKTLLIIGFITPVLSVINNTNQLVFTSSALPGLTWWDAVTFLFQYFSTVYAPFVIGFHLLNTLKNQRTLLIYLIVAGLIYLIPMLWEVRMSPQLHIKLYGFFPHEFKQQIREGGVRPVVFLGHGLVVGAFMVTACLAAFSVFKEERQYTFKKMPIHVIAILLLGGIVLCKTVGALFIIGLTLTILFLTKTRTQILICSLIAWLILLYPMIRELLIPILDKIPELIAEHKPERAESLAYRIKNEALMLEHTSSKMLTGWGGFGRNFVYDYDGAPISVPDGQWIITLSMYGWLGYISIFGLLSASIIKLRGSITRNASDFAYPAAIALILTANMIDLIPNSSFSALTMLMSGSLLGFIANKKQSRD